MNGAAVLLDYTVRNGQAEAGAGFADLARKKRLKNLMDVFLWNSRAVVFYDDFDKPIVGLANSYSTITPCNLGLNILAKRAEAALREAGAMPQMFGTMQEDTRMAISKGIVPRYALQRAMNQGLVGKEFINDVVKALA